MTVDEAIALAVSYVRSCGDQSALILANGPMGSGKTSFAKVFYSQFGLAPELVQSPTFLHLNEYALTEGRIGLHIDCDRFEAANDLGQLALEHYEGRKLIVYVEWPGLFSQYLNLNPQLKSMLGLSQKPLQLKFAADFSVSS
jgi:tRNA threonylcarbamoyl adenosine modification protein YjeE